MDPLDFDYAYAYSRRYYPAGGHGKITGSRATLLDHHRARIPRVDPGEAPIAARLAWPDGNIADVRVIDGKYMRAVRAPGATRGCTVAEFREAALGASEWRDGPFASPPYRGRAPASVISDAKTPEHYAGGENGVRKWDAEDDRSERVMVIARRLEGFVAIGDVVYMPCSEPYLEIRKAKSPAVGGATKLALAWGADEEFDMHADPESGRPAPKEGASSYASRARPAPNLAPPPYDGVLTDILGPESETQDKRARRELFRFPLHRWEDALAFARALAKNCYADLEDAVPVRYADADLLDPRGRLGTMIDILRKSYRDAKDDWDAILAQPRPVMEAWLDARDAAAKLGEDVDAEMVRDAFERTADLAHVLIKPTAKAGAATPTIDLDYGWSGKHLLLATLMRWRSVENGMDIAAELDAASTPESDAEAIAMGF